MAKGRASNGRSSIYQGANGSWHGWVTVGVNADGTPDRRHRRGRTQKEVTAKVRELEGWMTHWVHSIAKAAVKPKTFVGYEVDVRVHIVPNLGAHRLDRLQPEHVEKMFTRIAAAGASPGTMNHVRRSLVTALNEAVSRGRCVRNVAKLVKLRQVEHEIEPLTADDALAILERAAEERNGAAWIVAVSLGLRRGEVLGLRWTDVDLSKGTFTVRRALSRLSWRHGCDRACGRKRGADCPQRQGGGLVFDEPKSSAGRRMLVLPGPLVDIIRAHRQAQLEERLRAGQLWEDHGLVFAGPTGRPSIPIATRRRGTPCSPARACGPPGYTTPDTRRPPCSSSPASTLASSWT